MSNKKIANKIQEKKDRFVSQYIKHNPIMDWETIDNWYFDHICTVLVQAKKIFESSEEDLFAANLDMKK